MHLIVQFSVSYVELLIDYFRRKKGNSFLHVQKKKEEENIGK